MQHGLSFYFCRLNWSRQANNRVKIKKEARRIQMKITRSETGIYFVEPVCDEDVRFLDALMAAVDAFEKAYYPIDTAEGGITTASQDVE